MSHRLTPSEVCCNCESFVRSRALTARVSLPGLPEAADFVGGKRIKLKFPRRTALSSSVPLMGILKVVICRLVRPLENGMRASFLSVG